MGLLIRTLQRIAIFSIGALSIWLIVFVIFDFADQRMPVALALALTYAIGAYVILPYAVRMGLKFSQLRHVPSFTVAADGLPADPVNLALYGTREQLRAAFAAIGWVEAENLTLASSWRMIKAFVFNRPYPTAPFSTLFLFGRGQDIGFQKAIDDSPRRRHHVRFWARSIGQAQDFDLASFWLNTDIPPEGASVPWVGAATKDTGFGLTKLTFQITHATDADANAERDYVISVLREADTIGPIAWENTGDRIDGEHINRYITDGDVAIAALGKDARLPGV
ncbi:MAG TPA: LssY C-terminal domain-containing protein [Hyphomicrobium sp.]|nr:LssY C-terminal domain-containing protein [Hyphomicrobium sp.]